MRVRQRSDVVITDHLVDQGEQSVRLCLCVCVST